MHFSPTKKEIQNRILEYDTPDAPDDLIVMYQDFLKVRDFLFYYPFNPVVFKCLLKLTVDLWISDKRISRLSLLKALKGYYSRYCDKSVNRYNRAASKHKSDSFPDEIKALIFHLFKLTVKDDRFITPLQVDEARKAANHLLIGMTLPDKDIKWLCDNAFVSEQVLNRVLRYPCKSEIITGWVKKNFENDQLRTRRYELIGWLLDYDPDYVINESTLLYDYQHFVGLDINELRQFYRKELGSFAITTISGDSTNIINFSFRIYGAPYGKLRLNVKSLDEVEAVLHFVSSDLDNIKVKMMIWAIAQSRLESDKKVEMLKKYYTEATHLEILRAATNKFKNADLLRWILGKMESLNIKDQEKHSKNNFIKLTSDLPF